MLPSRADAARRCSPSGPGEPCGRAGPRCWGRSVSMARSEAAEGHRAHEGQGFAACAVASDALVATQANGCGWRSSSQECAQGPRPQNLASGLPPGPLHPACPAWVRPGAPGRVGAGARSFHCQAPTLQAACSLTTASSVPTACLQQLHDCRCCCCCCMPFVPSACCTPRSSCNCVPLPLSSLCAHSKQHCLVTIPWTQRTNLSQLGCFNAQHWLRQHGL